MYQVRVYVYVLLCIFLFILHTWWFTIFDSTFVIGWMLFADDELRYYIHSHRHYICNCRFAVKTIKIVIIFCRRRCRFAFALKPTHRLNNHDESRRARVHIYIVCKTFYMNFCVYIYICVFLIHSFVCLSFRLTFSVWSNYECRSISQCNLWLISFEYIAVVVVVVAVVVGGVGNRNMMVSH